MLSDVAQPVSRGSSAASVAKTVHTGRRDESIMTSNVELNGRPRTWSKRREHTVCARGVARLTSHGR
jgi:hypothetical protein